MGKRQKSSSDEQTLGSRIRAARERLGWSQEKLAEKSGLARLTITRFESGARTGAHAETLARIAEALGVGLSDLMPAGEAHPIPIDDYLVSPWAQIDKPTVEEIAQLRGIPAVFWSNVKPTPAHIHEILGLIRASAD